MFKEKANNFLLINILNSIYIIIWNLKTIVFFSGIDKFLKKLRAKFYC